MPNWEYSMFYWRTSDPKKFLNSTTCSAIWTVKDDKGKTGFDTLQECGKAGWELVSVTPIETSVGNSSYTAEVLFVLKRQL